MKERLGMRNNWRQVRFYIPDTGKTTSLGPAEGTGHDEGRSYPDWNPFPQSGEYAAAFADWWKGLQQTQPSLAWSTKVIGIVVPWICQNWLPAIFLIFLFISEIILHKP